MIGGFADCCARVLSGQPATAPPRSVMNSRRLIASPGARDVLSKSNIVGWRGTPSV
jgi:hypothetical protein